MSPVHLPISCLLPLSATQAGPSEPLPSPAYIVGSLPVTSPIHVALAYLSICDTADLPTHTGVNEGSTAADFGSAGGKGKGKAVEGYQDTSNRAAPLRPAERALIITGSKDTYTDLLLEEDEDSFRTRSGNFDVLKRLQRVDIRYCPTAAHLRLLLLLVSETNERVSSRIEPHHVLMPSMVILWDVAGLFMMEQEVDENEPPGPSGTVLGDNAPQSDARQVNNSGRKFRPDICLSNYMDILSTAKAAVAHLTSLHPADPPVRLTILEPNLTPASSLPILPPLNSENEDPKMSRTNRERRIKLVDGARWVFGKAAMATIEPYSIEDYDLGMEHRPPSDPLNFIMRWEGRPGQVAEIVKEKCAKAPFAMAIPEAQDDARGAAATGWRRRWAD
ncbi:hypothetical protein IAU60_004063 [Kwoniella sp. DSM 27419]